MRFIFYFYPMTRIEKINGIVNETLRICQLLTYNLECGDYLNAAQLVETTHGSMTMLKDPRFIDHATLNHKIMIVTSLTNVIEKFERARLSHSGKLLKEIAHYYVVQILKDPTISRDEADEMRDLKIEFEN